MRTKWTYEMIVEEAKKYQSRIELFKNSANAYHAARRRGILDDVCSHMVVTSISWTYEMIAEEAKKYETINDFRNANINAYNAAHSRGILDEVCSHMTTKLISWTYEMIAEEAKKYETRVEFRKSKAYQIAQKRGILDDVCSHMKYVHTHLYIFKIPHEKNIYKIGVSNNPKRRVNDFRSRSPFDELGDVISVKTDMCVQYEKEILGMAEPYQFEEKFVSSSEIREFDNETLKFILKKYFGVDNQ